MNPIVLHTIEELPQAAKKFLVQTKGYNIFAFDAPMGTGKTTFITALCREMGINDVINSPTFAIINEYALPNATEVVYHMDCYRLEKLEDALNLGFMDYLESGNCCFIEWPDVIAPLLPENTLYVQMREQSDGSRIITFVTQNSPNNFHQ